MTARKVNPPPQLKIPKAFLEDREVREFVKQQNTILFQLWHRTGGDVDFIDTLDNFSTNSFNTYAQFLQKQIDGFPEFTIDTTGFTSDLTFITTDKVIA